MLIDVVTVTKDNMMQTVVKDGFHPYDEIYRGVPERSGRRSRRHAMSEQPLLATRGLIKRFGGRHRAQGRRLRPARRARSTRCAARTAPANSR